MSFIHVHVHVAQKYFTAFSQTTNELRLFSKLIRLDRIISNRGGGSRADVTKLLQTGQVIIKDKIVKSGSLKVSEDVEITVNGKELFHVNI
jgi:RNA-binding protein YlmH